MKKIMIALFFAAAQFVLTAQDYSLIYSQTVRAPGAAPSQVGQPGNKPAVSSGSVGVSYDRLLIKGNSSVYFLTGSDTTLQADYQSQIKGNVYYGNLVTKEILRVNTIYLKEYATKYSFSKPSDWVISKEYIPYKKYKAYLATRKEFDGEEVRAYFVPEIPISIGPDNVAGLPGLIVRVEKYGSVLELVAMYKKSVDSIKIPHYEKEKIISNEEFHKKLRGEILKKYKKN